MVNTHCVKCAVKEFKDIIEPDHRYSSFDYCYNYFYNKRGTELTNDIEKSCLVLGFYLASWGMFRGSSFLLQKSAKYFQKTIEYIATLDEKIWLIDVPDYIDDINIITEIYTNLKSTLIPKGKKDLTLITKVMLGVFGFVPAFDKYFTDAFREIYKKEGCGFSSFNAKSLGHIYSFYKANRDEIDNIADNTYTFDFLTNEKTQIHYPKAKIIDMYGFTVGLKMVEDRKENIKYLTII
ncbi:MAG: hypothetical protein V1773_01500 [bacterium]